MISVITPVYNGKRFIESCMMNVIEQKCLDVEHIIVDGCSNDGTIESIERYAEHYEHIRWVSEKDKGQSDAMNKGVAMARGEILSFLNVDDYYEPEALNEVFRLFKDLPDFSLLVGNCKVWDNNGDIQWVNKPKNLEITKLLTGCELLYPFPVNPSAYFYNKSLHEKIGDFDINEHYTMDIDFILKAAMYKKPFYVDKPFGNFRYIEGTKTFNDMKSNLSEKRFKHTIEIYREKLPLIKKLALYYFLTLGKILQIARSSLHSCVNTVNRITSS